MGDKSIHEKFKESVYWNIVLHEIRYSISDAEFCIWLSNLVEEHLTYVGSSPDQLQQAMNKLIDRIMQAHRKATKET